MCRLICLSPVAFAQSFVDVDGATQIIALCSRANLHNGGVMLRAVLSCTLAPTETSAQRRTCANVLLANLLSALPSFVNVTLRAAVLAALDALLTQQPALLTGQRKPFVSLLHALRSLSCAEQRSVIRMLDQHISNGGRLSSDEIDYCMQLLNGEISCLLFVSTHNLHSQSIAPLQRRISCLSLARSCEIVD